MAPRSHRVRLYVEVDVERSDGPAVPGDVLDVLILETVREAVGVGEVFGTGDERRPSAYEVTECRVAPLDAATARKLG